MDIEATKPLDWPCIITSGDYPNRNTPIDSAEEAFFLGACFFWRILIDPISRLRSKLGLGIFYLFTTSLHAAALGVFMTLAQSPWYIDYTVTAPRWGISALEDQQLAGLIMWMPACAIYAFAASVLLALGLRELDLLSEKADLLPSKGLDSKLFKPEQPH